MSSRTALLAAVRRASRTPLIALGALALVLTGLVAASPAQAAGSNWITVTPLKAWVTEGGVATFRITAQEPIVLGSNSHPGVVPQTVHYSTKSFAGICVAAPTGCAYANSDYTPTFGTLNFDATHTSYDVSVPTTDDATQEPNEAFSLTTDANKDTAQTVILDNDPDGLSVFAVGVDQNGNRLFRVVRTNGTFATYPTTVRVQTADDTARAPYDYTAVNTLVSIPAFSSVSPVVTVTTSCAHRDADSQFYLNLSATARGQRIVGYRATGGVFACIH